MLPRPKCVKTLLCRRQPAFLILSVTSRCNASCAFCFNGDAPPVEKGSSELSTAEYDLISRKCGCVPYLLISGGEPVLRKDLPLIIDSFIRNANSRFVTVPSNGLLPGETLGLLERLTGDHPSVHFRAAFSVDFPDIRHDSMRGVDGCLESVVEGARLLRDLRVRRPNITIEVVSIYAPWNSGTMAELRSWVRTNIQPDNHELHVLRAMPPEVLAKDVDSESFLSELRIFREEGRRKESRRLSSFFRALNDTYHDALKRIYDGKDVPPCMSGQRIAVVDEYGRVRLCELRPEFLGSLREMDYDLGRVLGSRQAREQISCMNREKCVCTWECSVSTNIISAPLLYPVLLWRTLRKALTKRKMPA